MSTYRIYVDSRDRKSGSPTAFEYALPFSLPISEPSLANIDVVVLHNSIKTVTAGVNDMIYMRENDNLEFERYRTPTIAEGYYTINSLRLAIQDALNGPTKILPGDYQVVYNERLARFQFSHPSIRFGDRFVIFSQRDQLVPNVPTMPAIQNGNGAWKLMGLETGNSVCVFTEDNPGTAPDAPYAPVLYSAAH